MATRRVYVVLDIPEEYASELSAGDDGLAELATTLACVIPSDIAAVFSVYDTAADLATDEGAL